MLFPVNKVSKISPWFILVAVFALSGCVDEGDIGIPGSDSDSAETANDSQEDVVPGGDTQVPGDEAQVPGDDGGVPGGDPDLTPGEDPEAENHARLTWQAPTHRINGEGLYLGEIREYVISYGNDPDALDSTVTVDSDGTLSMEHTIEELAEGGWYFTIQTVDHDGNISEQADVVTKTI